VISSSHYQPKDKPAATVNRVNASGANLNGVMTPNLLHQPNNSASLNNNAQAINASVPMAHSSLTNNNNNNVNS
jgi:hypothetical protein